MLGSRSIYPLVFASELPSDARQREFGTAIAFDVLSWSKGHGLVADPDQYL